MSWGFDTSSNRFRSINIQGYLDISGGNLTLRNNMLLVNGDSSFNGSLTINQRLSVGSTLDVSGITTLRSALSVLGAVSIGKTLDVSGITTLHSALSVLGTTSIGSTLDVSGITTLHSALTVNGAASIGSTLDVSGITLLHSGLSVLGITDLCGALIVSGTTTFQNGLSVLGDTSIGGKLDVTGITTLHSGLSVLGAASIGKTLDVSGITTLRSALNVFGATALSSTLSVSGITNLHDISANGLLDVSSVHILHDISINGNTIIGTNNSTNATINSSATFISNAQFNNTANFLNIASFNGTNVYTSSSTVFTAYGLVSIMNNLGVSGSVDISTNLRVNGSTYLNGKLSVSDSIICDYIGVSGSVDISTNLSVNGATYLNGKLSVSNSIICDYIGVSGSVDISTNLSVNGATYLNGKLSVSDSIICDYIGVSGSVDISTNLRVNGSTYLNGQLSVSDSILCQDISVNGSILCNTLSVKGAMNVVYLSITNLSCTNISGGYVDISGNLSVNGTTYLNSKLSVSDSIQCDYLTAPYSYIQNLSAGMISVANGINCNSLSCNYLYINNDLSLAGNLISNHSVYINNNISIGGTVFANMGVNVYNNDVLMTRLTNFKDFTSNSLIAFLSTCVTTSTVANNDLNVVGNLSVGGNTILNSVTIGDTTDPNSSCMVLDNLQGGWYNPITQTGDRGIIFGVYVPEVNSQPTTSYNVSGALCICPWSQRSSGIRMTDGNINIIDNVDISGSLFMTNGSTIYIGADISGIDACGTTIMKKNTTYASIHKIIGDVGFTPFCETNDTAIIFGLETLTGPPNTNAYALDIFPWSNRGSGIRITDGSINIWNDTLIINSSAVLNDTSAHIFDPINFNDGNTYFNTQLFYYPPNIGGNNSAYPYHGFLFSVGSNSSQPTATNYSNFYFDVDTKRVLELTYSMMYSTVVINTTPSGQIWTGFLETNNAIKPNKIIDSTSGSVSVLSDVIAGATSKNGSYGIAGQVLSSGGPNSGIKWIDAPSSNAVNGLLTIGNNTIPGGIKICTQGYGSQPPFMMTTSGDYFFNPNYNPNVSINYDLIYYTSFFLNSTTNYGLNFVLKSDNPSSGHSIIDFILDDKIGVLTLNSTYISIGVPFNIQYYDTTWHTVITLNNTTGAISAVGAINAASFNATSDYRLKSNITDISDNITIDALRPVTYTLNSTSKTDYGLIAHELQEQFPDMVTGEKDGEGFQSVNYIALISILIKEVQSLKTRVSLLENASIIGQTTPPMTVPCVN